MLEMITNRNTWNMLEIIKSADASTVDFTPKPIPFQHFNVDITFYIPFGSGAKAYINSLNFITA